jgi:hypothetical protein
MDVAACGEWGAGEQQSPPGKKEVAGSENLKSIASQET